MLASSRLFFLLCFLGLQISATAQIHDRLHWVFPVDSVDQIDFDLVDPYEANSWDGNQIMVTSEVTVYNATKGIVRFFMEDDRRWDVIDTLMGTTLLLDSYHSRRAPIVSGGDQCYEVVQVKVYIPNNFIKDPNGTSWFLKEEEAEVDDQ
ncbi:MAG: hypothetical protein AAFZ63_22960 [Bacteroidota bacterium]